MPNVKLGQLIWEITGDTSKLDSSVNKSESRLAKFGTKATKFGKSMLTKVTLPILGIGVALVKAASDAEETAAKFNTVFSPVINDAADAAKNLSDNFGLSSKQSQELLGNTGDLLTGFGFTAASALDLSSQVNQLAVDLASFTNFSGGAAGASAALTKALLGERESVKSLGISILDADVKAKVLQLRQEGLRFETERQAKAYATLQIALEQSKNAQGDFARTQDSFANQFRQLKADIGDLAAEFGSILLPFAKDLVKTVRDIVDRFRDMDDSTKLLIIKLAGFAALIGPIAIGIGMIAKAATAAKVAMGLLSSNPIFLVAAGIAAGVILISKAISKIDNEAKNVAFKTEIIKEDIDDLIFKVQSWKIESEEVDKILAGLADKYKVTREEIDDAVIAQGGLTAEITEQLATEREIVAQKEAQRIIEEEQLALAKDMTTKTDEELIAIKAAAEERYKSTESMREQLDALSWITRAEEELAAREAARALAQEERISKSRADFKLVNDALLLEISALQETAEANAALGLEYDLQEEKRKAVLKAVGELIDLGYKTENANIQTLLTSYSELFIAEEEEIHTTEEIKEAYAALAERRTELTQRNWDETSLRVEAIYAERDAMLASGIEEIDAEAFLQEQLNALRNDTLIADAKRRTEKEKEDAIEADKYLKSVLAEAEKEQKLREEARKKEKDSRKALIEEFRVLNLSEFDREVERIQGQAAAYIKAGTDKLEVEEWLNNEILKLQEKIDAEIEAEREKALTVEKKRVEEILAARKKANEEAIKAEEKRRAVHEEFSALFRNEYEERIDIVNEEFKHYIAYGVDRVEAEAWAQEEINKIREEAAEEERERQRDLNKEYVDGIIDVVSSIQQIDSNFIDSRIQGMERALDKTLSNLDEEEDAALEMHKNWGASEEELDRLREGFDEKRVKAQQKVELAKARAARKQALFDKALSIAQIAINTIVAASKVAYNPVLAGIVIAAGIASGIAAASKPIPPLPVFQGGGIVEGEGGEDSQTVQTTPGEMILNREQQENLLSILNGGGNGGETYLILDGEKVGRFVRGEVEDAADNNTIRINSQVVREG